MKIEIALFLRHRDAHVALRLAQELGMADNHTLNLQRRLIGKT
ncbi:MULTISPECIES: hypothetical protein [unclassified Caballeronia]|nr:MULTISPECIES: hypothetical protein [unclassified Caballeronia]